MPGRPIKVLHVVFSLEAGGLENGVVNVAAALNPDSVRVGVCCLERAGRFADRLPPAASVHVLGKAPGFSLQLIGRLAAVIRQTNPDVIHTHNLGPLMYSSLATALGRWRPILHSEHGQLAADQLERRRLLQRQYFYRSCRKIHTVSIGLRQQLIGLGFPADRIVAVVNGVDTERFHPLTTAATATARHRIGLPAKGPVLGIVGRFTPDKRHGILFTAFEQLRRHRPDARLLVVGGRAESPDRGIHFAGFQGDPRPYYQAMDLLVAPSTVEGLSNVMLEAMACGVPTLSHRACGSAEVITSGEDGFIADLQTPESIFTEVRQILAEPAGLKRAGGQARETVVKRFSLSRMVHGYEQLYLEMTPWMQ